MFVPKLHRISTTLGQNNQTWNRHSIKYRPHISFIVSSLSIPSVLAPILPNAAMAFIDAV
jgi:hypothetical protein